MSINNIGLKSYEDLFKDDKGEKPKKLFLWILKN